MRAICAFALVSAIATAGAPALNAEVLPDQFGSWKRAAKPAAIETQSDRMVWDEYGLQSAERAEYSAGAAKTLSITAWRLKDTTGAWAASQWLGAPATQHGNYVLRIEGALSEAERTQLVSKLPDVDRAANPSLAEFLPAQGRVKGSERYVLGPASLAQFESRIPSDLAAFAKGAEGQLASYRSQVGSGGEAKLVLFAYPTPQIAAERAREFEKRSEWKARRHGPMVAVVLDAATPEAAGKLLGSVAYQPKISWSEHVPKNENPGDMLLAICILAAGLMVASALFGLFFGGLRQVFGSKFGVQAIDENFTSLHLDQTKN